MRPLHPAKGPIAWMARNSVAANLLLVTLIVGGFVVLSQIKIEIFPEFDLDIVRVTVPYPGASPEEVEQGILLAIEERVRTLDGVKRVTSTATEGSGSVAIELLIGTNAGKALQDVKSEVDRITSFPEEAEEPRVALLASRERVVTMALYGDVDRRALRDLAEHLREELLADPRVTLVEFVGAPAYEIEVQVPRAALQAHDLTLDEVAARIRQGAIELPGGGLKTDGGEILLRTTERRDYGREFLNLPILREGSGSELRLGDVAHVVDGFEDTDTNSYFGNDQAVVLNAFRVGEQTPLDVSAAVKEFIAELEERLPPTVGVTILYDVSEILADRMNLLMRNALLGLALVIAVLGLFLKVRLAGWVTVGIPVSVMGAFLVMPLLGVSINMVSLAAFILTLGIIVDDAIVVGESIHERRESGLPAYRAAVDGTRQVAIPVFFAVLTTMVAFAPLLAIPGVMGKIFGTMPLVVLPVLFFSLIESFFILPAHLAHDRGDEHVAGFGWIERIQERFSRVLDRFIRDRYTPALEWSLRYRYVTAASGIAILIVTVGLIAGGRIPFTFMPKVDTDVVTAGVTLAYGTPYDETARVQRQVVDAAHRVIGRQPEGTFAEGVYTHLGNPLFAYDIGLSAGRGAGGSHLTEVQVYLVPTDQRSMTATQFAQRWRREIGPIPSLESLSLEYSTGPSSEPPINVELSHPDLAILERAAKELAGSLQSFAGVSGIDDGFELGKPQLDFRIRPEGQSLGITAAELGRQLRDAFHGAEAIRQQRGRNEIRVMVRLPEKERTSLHAVEEFLVRAPDGSEIPLLQAADVEPGRAYTKILRADGRRVVTVTADVDEASANAGEVLASLEESILPTLLEEYPGLRYSFEGQTRQQQESIDAMRTGFILALLAIFVMIAVPFKSYAQPIIVMLAIPFGVVGAVIGHVVMGYPLSVISMMGIVALSGVVVNASLVLIDTANQTLRGGLEPTRAIVGACIRRFRPILLTSVTTFFGLLPMIFETSIQARFLVPMTISLGYGVLFATVITLLFVPAFFLIIEDARARLGFRQTHVISDDDEV